jgi:hypothetical protein
MSAFGGKADISQRRRTHNQRHPKKKWSPSPYGRDATARSNLSNFLPIYPNEVTDGGHFIGADIATPTLFLKVTSGGWRQRIAVVAPGFS